MRKLPEKSRKYSGGTGGESGGFAHERYMSLINVKDIRKVYRVDEEKIVALGRINLRIEQGEICCILGTSVRENPRC